MASVEDRHRLIWMLMWKKRRWPAVWLVLAGRRVDIVQTKDISQNERVWGRGILQVPRINHFKFAFCRLITRIKFGAGIFALVDG